MQVVEAVFPYAGLPDVAGSVVLILLVLGFPVALGLSWVFEVTPPSLRLEDPPRAAQTPSAAPPERVRKELRPDSVAVLPFDNLSTDPENEYFSDGITDDIISAVAHIDGLRVLSRASASQYKGVTGQVNEIGAELGVATIVMGGVRRSGSRVRVTAQVIDARTDDHLWTHTYDRELEDIFEVQSEVASSVAQAVQRELSTVDRQRIRTRGTSDPESYDLYLRGRYLWSQRAEGAVSDSIRYFQRALERDGDFALAHSGLADAYTVLGIYGMRDPKEVMEAARSAADTALSLEPTLGEAIASRACVQSIYDWDWTQAEAEFRRALELAPSYATAYQWYAVNLLAPLGRFDEAHERLEQARGLDPSSGAVAISHCIVAFYARELERATRSLEELAKLHPRFALVYLFLGQCYELAGDLARGVETLRRATELADESSETLAALGHALACAGRAPESEAIADRLGERSERVYVSPALLAQVAIGLGRHEVALDRLEEAVTGRATDLMWIGVRPVYDPLREHPRWRAIQADMGLDHTGGSA